MMKSRLLGAACALYLVVFTTTANAALIDVFFTDLDGPQWTGSVDTSADTLTISSWTEGIGGISYWTPSSLPLVWDAKDNSGSSFDVPDDWDGTIGSTWGYLSPDDLSAISWNEGTFDSGLNTVIPGWGISSLNGAINVSNDETSLSFIPITSSTSTASVADAAGIVPLPTTVWLFGSGLLGLIGIANRKKTA